MTYGIKSINSGGFTQIDENYRNFLIVQTGNVLCSPYGTALSFVSVPAGITNYSIFVRFDQDTRNDAITAGETRTIGGVIDKVNNRFGVRTATAGATDHYADYAIVIDPIDAASSGGYGLDIFDSSGELAYSSTSNVMRCYSMTFAQDPEPDYTGGTPPDFDDILLTSGSLVDESYTLLDPLNYAATVIFSYPAPGFAIVAAVDRAVQFDYANNTAKSVVANSGTGFVPLVDLGNYIYFRDSQRTYVMARGN